MAIEPIEELATKLGKAKIHYERLGMMNTPVDAGEKVDLDIAYAKAQQQYFELSEEYRKAVKAVTLKNK